MNLFELYQRHEYWFAASQLILAMLGMGAMLTTADFHRVLKSRHGLVLGIVLQIFMVPAVAMLCLSVLDATPGVAIGLAICSAIPAGAGSNLFTFFSRGHVALSVSLTAMTTTLALFTLPLVLGLILAQQLPSDFYFPRKHLAREVFFCLLVPLASGMLIKRWLPNLAGSISLWSIRGSMLVIGLIVISALGTGRLDLDRFGIPNVLRVAALLVAICTVTIFICRALRTPQGEIAAINFGVVMRNTNLGLLVVAFLFPTMAGARNSMADDALFVVLLYAGMMVTTAGSLTVFYRTQHERRKRFN